jgi:predicted  nucleic acid-binding Zn-ribbon protein
LEEARTIKEQISFLVELQVVDSEIYELNREKNQTPEKIKAIEDSLEAKKSGIKEAEERLKVLQLKLKDKEVSLQQKEEHIKKLQTQLYQIKTNKEYSAMLTEIEGIKADNSIEEEEIIKLMDEIDAAKRKIIEEKELFKEEDSDANKEKDKINTRLRDIDVRLSRLSTERQKIVPNVERQILARYERVLTNRDGLAMVKVEEGACGGCHMNLPPQVISDVKLREDIIVCGSCSRILYLDENAEIN